MDNQEKIREAIGVVKELHRESQGFAMTIQKERTLLALQTLIDTANKILALTNLKPLEYDAVWDIIDDCEENDGHGEKWINSVKAAKAICAKFGKSENLKPLEPDDVNDFFLTEALEKRVIWHTDEYVIKDMYGLAKLICSHFSKPVIKYPEKKCFFKRDFPSLKRYEEAKLKEEGYNQCREDTIKLNGEGV